MGVPVVRSTDIASLMIDFLTLSVSREFSSEGNSNNLGRDLSFRGAVPWTYESKDTF